MSILVDFMPIVLPMLYGLVSVNYLVYFFRADPFAERTATPSLVVVGFLHALFLLSRAVLYQRHPVGTLPEATSVVAFTVVLVYLYLEQVQRTKTTGVFIITLVVLLHIGASAFFPHSDSESAATAFINNPVFGFHAVLSVCGYSAFALGAVYGVMFLLLYRNLKRKKFGLVFERFPSLDILSRMVVGSSIFGWFFLTGTIFLGVVMSLEKFPDFYKDLKFMTTVIVWVVYGLSIGSYYLLNWRGARAVYLSLIGFAFAVFTALGSVFWWSSFHAFLV